MIAWDTHNILHMADEALKSGEQVEFERIAIKGAADLFVDTLVIFLRVLMILSIITGGGD
jgi:FtsH-binding integral membrane protein